MRATEQQIEYATKYVKLLNRKSFSEIQRHMKLPTGIAREIYDELINRGVIKL